jgi:subtilisin family serine protease
MAGRDGDVIESPSMNYAKLHPWLMQSLAVPATATLRVIVKFVGAVPSDFARSAGGALGLDVEPSVPDDSYSDDSSDQADVVPPGLPASPPAHPPANPPSSPPSSVDGPVTFSLLPAVALAATVAQIDAWSYRPDVEIIWLDPPVKLNLNQSVPLVGTPSWWRNGYTGKGVKVAVVDTGIDASHPDFAGRILKTVDFTGQGVDDIDGHGTHVAGIVGGSGIASRYTYQGVAPGCSLLIAKSVPKDPKLGRSSWVVQGIEWAVKQGAQVINISLGVSQWVSGDGSDALSKACDAAVAKGACVCVAAGNDGPERATINDPGSSPLVITVGSTNKDDSVSSFSSHGPTLDRRLKPDVCFPGMNITSARARHGTRGTSGYYVINSGTSMAAPHASGACALLLEANPESTPQDVKAHLMALAEDIGDDATAQGAGRVALDAAFGVHSPAPLPLPSTYQSAASMFSGQPKRPLFPAAALPHLTKKNEPTDTMTYALGAGLVIGAGALVGIILGSLAKVRSPRRVVAVGRHEDAGRPFRQSKVVHSKHGTRMQSTRHQDS